MKVILEILNGPTQGLRREIKLGEVVRVGRSWEAEFVIGSDPRLSRMHFAIEQTGRGWTVRDLKSSLGTVLNGVRVADAVLADGDRILAGQTEFRIHLQGSVPHAAPAVPAVLAPAVLAPVAAAAPAAAAASAFAAAATLDLPRLAWFAALFREERTPLYALLDAARDWRIRGLLQTSGEEHQSLYAGEKGEQLADYAPYLVRLPNGSRLLETLIEEGWGQSWGVFLTSHEPFRAVRRHFRQFLRVRLEEGKIVYFRFYDPRVLRTFLPTCTPEQTRALFQGIEAYWMEDRGAAILFRMKAGPTGVVANRLPVPVK